MPYPSFSSPLRRREVIKTGLGLGAAALVPWHAARADLPQVARDKTMILVWGGREGRWVDWDLWNPYSIGSNHQNGPNLIYEPLAYYSAFADKTYMWLAESYEFAEDFKRLTIKTRSGINWSDGKPFSAEDVAYTLNTLRDIGPKVRWGIDVQQAVNKAAATDPNTVVIEFEVCSPRFFFFMTYKYDIGVYIVPKHVFDGQDWTTSNISIWKRNGRSAPGHGRSSTPHRNRKSLIVAPAGGPPNGNWHCCRWSNATSGCPTQASNRPRRR
jgi:ABC-type transport system substrate-binding protein